MTSSYWDTQRNALRSDDRRNEIVKHVTSASKKISVDELASLFEVSAVTIRSDLDWLERQGKLKRVRGGAIVLDRMRDVADISRRMTINIERKKHISQVANSCVDDGDAIFVDSGSTTFEFVKTLKNKQRITIITQDITIASFVDSELLDASVIVLGGVLRPQHGYSWGPLTLSIIDRLYADKAFLGANGFVPKQGFMVENPQSDEIKRAFIDHAQQSYVLVDATKVGVHSFIKFAGLAQVDYIIMDEDPEGIVNRDLSTSNPRPKLLLF